MTYFIFSFLEVNWKKRKLRRTVHITRFYLFFFQFEQTRPFLENCFFEYYLMDMKQKLIYSDCHQDEKKKILLKTTTKGLGNYLWASNVFDTVDRTTSYPNMYTGTVSSVLYALYKKLYSKISLFNVIYKTILHVFISLDTFQTTFLIINNLINIM